jgi:hypothetical protein
MMYAKMMSEGSSENMEKFEVHPLWLKRAAEKKIYIFVNPASGGNEGGNYLTKFAQSHTFWFESTKDGTYNAATPTGSTSVPGTPLSDSDYMDVDSPNSEESSNLNKDEPCEIKPDPMESLAWTHPVIDDYVEVEVLFYNLNKEDERNAGFKSLRQWVEGCIRPEEYVTVIACGGDGTAARVYNGMKDSHVHVDRTALGIIPLGTGKRFFKIFEKLRKNQFQEGASSTT